MDQIIFRFYYGIVLKGPEGIRAGILGIVFLIAAFCCLDCVRKQKENDEWPNLLAVLMFQMNIFFLALEAFLTGIGTEGHPVNYPIIRGVLFMIALALWGLNLLYMGAFSAMGKKALSKYSVITIGGTLGYCILFYAAVLFLFKSGWEQLYRAYMPVYLVYQLVFQLDSLLPMMPYAIGLLLICVVLALGSEKFLQRACRVAALNHETAAIKKGMESGDSITIRNVLRLSMVMIGCGAGLMGIRQVIPFFLGLIFLYGGFVWGVSEIRGAKRMWKGKVSAFWWFVSAVIFSIACALVCYVEIRDRLLILIDRLLSPLFTFGASWFATSLDGFNNAGMTSQLLMLAAVFVPGFFCYGILKWGWNWIHREGEKLYEVYPGIVSVFWNELLIPWLLFFGLAEFVIVGSHEELVSEYNLVVLFYSAKFFPQWVHWIMRTIMMLSVLYILKNLITVLLDKKSLYRSVYIKTTLLCVLCSLLGFLMPTVIAYLILAGIALLLKKLIVCMIEGANQGVTEMYRDGTFDILNNLEKKDDEVDAMNISHEEKNTRKIKNTVDAIKEIKNRRH